jgi:hypothetical protein
MWVYRTDWRQFNQGFIRSNNSKDFPADLASTI